MEKKFFEDLKEKIQPYFDKDGTGHGFDHTQRVYDYAIKIAKEEKVDLDVIKTSALLHDISRKAQEECKLKMCHAEHGADLAKRILKKTSFPTDKIEAVCHAILAHRKRKSIQPNTKEAEIIRDADRLDLIGAIAIIRIFQHSEKNRNFVFEREFQNSKIPLANFINKKLSEIAPRNFKTKVGKQIAMGRYNFMKEFTDRIIKENSGEL